MQAYIKWITLIYGASKYGIPGAIIGFLIGVFVEQMLEGKVDFHVSGLFERKSDPKDVTLNSYQKGLLQLVSEAMRADGYISRNKIKFIKHYLYRQFKAVEANEMMIRLNVLIKTKQDAVSAATKLAGVTSNVQKKNIVRMLHGICVLKGKLSFDESNLIRTMAVNIGLTFEEYEQIQKDEERKKPIRKTFFKPNSYAILGIDKTASDKEVKKAYRALVLKFHPDKIEDPSEIDNEKFDEIQKAYDDVRMVRDIK